MAIWAVTGGAGFIGSRLANRLLANGHEVRALARRAIARRNGVLAVMGDVRDAHVVAELVRNADVIVHLAGYVHKRATTAEQQRECREVNVTGTEVVTSAVAKHSRNGFLVHVSTANVYPSSDVALDESAPLSPRTIYGATKLESEGCVTDAIARGDLGGAVIRPAMVFGPDGPGNLPRLVRLVRSPIVPLLGNGQNVKTLTPVERLLDAVEAIVESRGQTSGGIFNVAGISLTMRALIELIAAELQRTPRIARVPALPLRTFGRVLDLATKRASLPSFAQMIETYTSSSYISDARVAALPTFRSTDSERALRATVRELSASR